MDTHAVVIGAGMAGLAAARVLARRYDRVTVLDRDELPVDPVPRKGVPQGQHGHILLVSGLRELDGLFPGLPDELVARGGVRFDQGTALVTHRYGRRSMRAPTGLELVSMSRPMLEGTIRDRVAREPAVTIRDRVAVAGFTGGERVTGVVLDDGSSVPADLVVDCTGRGSRSDRWLADLGFPAPERVEIKVSVAYTTRVYRRTPGELEGMLGALVLPAPPREQRAGLVLPIEGEKWLVAMGGWHIDPPPSDAATFAAYARSLPDPIIATLMDTAEPLSDPLVFRFPSSRRRLFEDLTRVPAGYVAVGDAICSFNPIYGQGMTIAAKEAVALGGLGDASAASVRAFYRTAADLIATPWQFAVGGDFAYPQTTGPRPRGIRLSNWYAKRIALAAQVNPEVNATFLSVQQLLTPPGALFTPAMMAKVFSAAVPWR